MPVQSELGAQLDDDPDSNGDQANSSDISHDLHIFWPLQWTKPPASVLDKKNWKSD